MPTASSAETASPVSWPHQRCGGSDRGGRRILLSVLACLAGAAWAAPAALAAGPSCQPAPVLQPGKTQLLDRVLVRPGATLAASQGGAGGRVLPAFSVLYVYARTADGKSVQVGASSACRPDGWVQADALVPWRHIMVAAFTSRSGRQPVLFFKDAVSLQPLLTTRDTGAAGSRLQGVAAGSDPSSAGIVSREPDTPVDMGKQFYLLPVLDATAHRFASAAPVRVLHVASLTKLAVPAASPSASEPGATAGAAATGTGTGDRGERHNFRTAVVFVMDATQSMDPYLDRVRTSLDRIYGRIEAEHLQDQVRFGLVAFRDDPKAVHGIEYGTRVFVDPNKVATRAQFDQAVAGLRAARVSSRAVAEDVYAGVASGLDDIDWSGFDGRFLVLVTDASAREPTTGIVTTHLDDNALALMAREKAVAVLALHLLTPEGGDRDHATAQRQYSALTRFPGRGPLYYQVPAGDVNEYAKRLDVITDSLVKLITSAQDNGTARVDAPVASPPPAAPPANASAPAADIEAIGHAMHLAYLGKVNGSHAPTMFEAWALDRDLANQGVQSLDIRVLLSRSQLSDLAATATALYDAFQKGHDDPDNFYKQLRSAALTLSRDPAKIGAASNRDLSQDILGEYLDGLPYASRIMALGQDDWLAMNPSEQQELIDDTAVKLQLYRNMEDDTSHWVSLAPGGEPEDAVYPVPIDALP